jgi:hypothetical protein
MVDKQSTLNLFLVIISAHNILPLEPTAIHHPSLIFPVLISKKNSNISVEYTMQFADYNGIILTNHFKALITSITALELKVTVSGDFYEDADVTNEKSIHKYWRIICESILTSTYQPRMYLIKGNLAKQQ